MTASSLALALACLLLGPPEGPAPAPDHHDIHAAPLQRMSFDESIGASKDAPIVAGYEDAVEDKRERDAKIPLQSQNPQVQVMPGYRVNAGTDNGFELQTTLTQNWSLEGYGRARRKAASAETDVLEADARARALEQRFGAADAWIRLHGAERRLALANHDLELAKQLVATLELGLEAGVTTRLDIAEAEATLAEIELIVVELGGEVHDLGLALARETGTTTNNPLGTRGDYPNPSLPDEPELRRRFAEVEQLPVVQLQRLQARAALAEATEAERQNGALLQGGTSVQLESTGQLVIFGVIGSTIPVRDRNQRSRATSHAVARTSEAEADQLAIELSATLKMAIHELRHTGERVDLIREKTLPALDQLIAARKTALELGEGTRAQLLAAELRRSQVARELAQAEADHAWARVHVWLYLQALESEAA